MTSAFLPSPPILRQPKTLHRKRLREKFTCNAQPYDSTSSSDDGKISWSVLHSRVSQLRAKEVELDQLIARNWSQGGYKPSVVASIPSDYVRKLSFAGNFLAFGTATGSVVFSDLVSGMRVVSMQAHTGQVTAVDYHRSMVVTAGAADLTVLVWDVEAFESRKYWSTRNTAGLIQEDLPEPNIRLEGHEDIITAVTIDEDGKRVYSASVDGSVRSWDLTSGKEVGVIRVGEPVFSMKITDVGYMLLGCASGRVQAFQKEKGLYLLSILCHSANITAVDFCEDSQTLVAGDSSGNIGLWSLKDSSKLGELPKHDAAVMSVQIDHTKVVSAGRDGCVAVSNISQLTRQYSIHGFTKYLAVAAFDHTRLIADGTNDVIVCHRFDATPDEGFH